MLLGSSVGSCVGVNVIGNVGDTLGTVVVGRCVGDMDGTALDGSIVGWLVR